MIWGIEFLEEATKRYEKTRSLDPGAGFKGNKKSGRKSITGE